MSGNKQATLKSIAAETGVSVSVISRVLSGKARQYRISEKTEKRVKDEADRLGFSGHPLATSPYLDRLVRKGRLQIQATTPLPRTLPAVVSLMTGSDPQTHGVRDNFHYTIGPAARTLAEVLGEHGFVGLALFLALGVGTFLTGRTIIRRARGSPDLAWASTPSRSGAGPPRFSARRGAPSPTSARRSRPTWCTST